MSDTKIWLIATFAVTAPAELFVLTRRYPRWNIWFCILIPSSVCGAASLAFSMMLSWLRFGPKIRADGGHFIEAKDLPILMLDWLICVAIALVPAMGTAFIFWSLRIWHKRVVR